MFVDGHNLKHPAVHNKLFSPCFTSWLRFNQSCHQIAAVTIKLFNEAKLPTLSCSHLFERLRQALLRPATWSQPTIDHDSSLKLVHTILIVTHTFNSCPCGWCTKISLSHPYRYHYPRKHHLTALARLEVLFAPLIQHVPGFDWVHGFRTINSDGQSPWISYSGNFFPPYQPYIQATSLSFSHRHSLAIINDVQRGVRYYLTPYLISSSGSVKYKSPAVWHET